jgi:nucleoside-diphosphate-sugar epimerase
MILAYESEKAPGSVYILAGPKYVTIDEWVETFARAAGIIPKIRHFPYPLAKAYSFVCEKLFKLFDLEPPIFRRHVNFFIKNRGYTIDRAKEDLGYQPKIDLSEGARRTIQWYREQGLL